MKAKGKTAKASKRKQPKSAKSTAPTRMSKARLDKKFGHESPYCLCKCGELVRPGSRFRPGHDARLKPGSQWRKAHPDLFPDSNL